MRRIFSLSVMALVMAAMIVAMAIPAFAAASPRASCVGEAFSNAEPGTKGQVVSQAAIGGGIGEEISTGAKVPREVNCGGF